MEALGIVKTYVKAYLLLPVVLLVPAIAILVTPFLLLSHLNLNRDTARELQVTAVATATAGILVYWGIVASSILDRARGLKK